MENTFHLLKDRPLGISPLYVRNDDQITGLTRLLTLALRILTLIQTLLSGKNGSSSPFETAMRLDPLG